MFYIGLMLLTGCLIALQAPVNAALSRATGPLEASLVSFFVGCCSLSVACLAFGKGSILKAVQAPVWQWSGGLLGAIMVCTALISVPRIGVLNSALAMIIGNLLMASVVDNFGWFGVPLAPFGLRRLFGLCLVLAGLFFIFYKK